MATVTSRIQAASGQDYQSRALMARGGQPVEELPPRQLYDLLKWYYLNNGLYDDIVRGLYDKSIWTEGMKPLRNPAFRVVEFYGAKLWPRNHQVVSDNAELVTAVAQVWLWSNWLSQRRVAARWLAMYGDLFIKIATRMTGGRVTAVYMQLIEPQYITTFDVDERRYLTYVRIDIPQTERVGDEVQHLTHTEVWDKATDSYRVWRHDMAADAPIDRLGAPTEEASMTTFGIDFVPVVHVKFRDIGEDRGMAAITHALDKIDEANRMATRLHQVMFRYNKATEVLEGTGSDTSGRPLPPPRIVGRQNGQYDDDDTVKVGNDRIVRLPSGWTWRQAVPALDYASMLAVVNAQMAELENDLPELAYYTLRNRADLSGRAVRLLLSDAVDRATEVRANAEAGLIQAQQMALTVGAATGVLPNLGDFDAGDLAHDFVQEDIFTLSLAEKMETVTAMTQAGIPLETALRATGWTAEEIAAMQEDKAADAELGRQMLEQARAAFDQAPAEDQDVQDNGANPRTV